MSQLHLNQIRARLRDRYLEHASALRIDNPNTDTDRFLSRALAALSIEKYADISSDNASTAVVDHDKDGGIDAIYYSTRSKTLYIAQSKWKNKTNGGIELGDVLKFCSGISNLLQSNSAYFGGPIEERWPALENALNELEKVVVILAFSSEVNLDKAQNDALIDVLKEFNQPTEVATYSEFSQERIHSYLASGVEGDAIDETIRLFQWGCVEQPHLAYYGQIAASDLVELHKKYGQRLFSSNIRQFLGKTGIVNQEIVHTATTRPDLFWYFNNGVTVIADNIRKTAAGGSKREAGDIACEGLSIVNGAQTVGTLAQIPNEYAANLANIMVPLRIISLATGGAALGVEITRATNTQNRVDSRNFVALSNLHQRIRRDLLMDGITYVVQQGDEDERTPNLFGVSEAFPAMACSLPSVEPAVLAKREISRLWENLDSNLHKEMFPEDVDAFLVWSNVKVVRLVEESLQKARSYTDTSRERTVLSHGNRLAAYIVFRLIAATGKTSTDDIAEMATRSAAFMSYIVADKYPNQYPAVIFKNNEICKLVATDVIDAVIISYEQEE